VNYYNHHIGDYARDTAHLSMLEDCAYRRMLDLYYAAERPLPLNRDGLYRLLRARTKEERKSVDTVLVEFFTEGETGWHNKRAELEIARAKEEGAENEAKRENERERQRRHRERRKELFAELRQHDIVPKFDVPTEELETLLSRARHGDRPSPVTDPQRLTNSQEPITNNQREKSARKRATPLPGDFAISERVKTWAQEKRFGSLEAHLEFFVGRMRASGKTYVDWDEAFMNCVREDWGEIRVPKKGNGRAESEPVKVCCAKCKNPISGAWTMTGEGRVHDACWQ
jgi:uncharacterized protein YdaU (DUF1376 family)